jgi:hypothetical protein
LSCKKTKVTKSARKLNNDEEILLANQDYDDNNKSTKKLESRSLIHNEFVKEMHISSSDIDDDDSSYVYSSGFLSCEETRVTKSACKLDSDEETSSVLPTKQVRL